MYKLCDSRQHGDEFQADTAVQRSGCALLGSVPGGDDRSGASVGRGAAPRLLDSRRMLASRNTYHSEPAPLGDAPPPIVIISNRNL